MEPSQHFQNNLFDLEKKLKSTLLPIKPSENFVGNLHSRLNESTIFHKQERMAFTLLTIEGGLLTGLIIFLLGKWLINKPAES